VAALASGGFVVVWLTESEIGPGIFAQSFGPNGKQEGSIFRIGPAGAGMTANPRVAGLPGGGFAVAWQRSRGEASSIEGCICGFDTDCASMSPVAFSTNSGAKKQSVPALAGLPDGSFVVAWQSNVGDGSGFAIYAQRFDRTGAKATGAFLVNSMKTNDQWQPAVSGLPDGGYVVTWSSALQDGSGQGVYAQAYNAMGPRAFTEYRVNTTVAGDQWQSATAALADGKLVVVWTSKELDGSAENVLGQRFDLMGLTAASAAASRINAATR
jgi:hypothetical protein